MRVAPEATVSLIHLPDLNHPDQSHQGQINDRSKGREQEKARRRKKRREKRLRRMREAGPGCERRYSGVGGKGTR